MNELTSSLRSITPRQRHNLHAEIKAALASTLRAPEPLSAVEWANEHFYLSAESSYLEGKWTTAGFQIAILNAMGNDDIREVNLKKSARIGYTKMLLAAMAYFVEHKKRNILLWQPTDGAAEEFAKQHVDPMIRDVPALKALAPWEGQKHKFNTVSYKHFSNSRQFHIKGGKSAKNYREKSVDVAIYDELSSFDANIDYEGDPLALGDKRLEGTAFPKSIRGSTPKIAGECQITIAADLAAEYFERWLPCPHCHTEQVLRWGGPSAHFGIKWDNDDPTTAYYLCEHCASVIDNESLPDMDDLGVWRSRNGISTVDGETFYSKRGKRVDAPASVTFHVWAIYSPWSSWQKIVSDFLGAKGNPVKLRTWINLTLGEPWEEESEQIDHHDLYMRREKYPATVPQGAVVLLGGADTQDDRLEGSIWGFGGEDGTEQWLIAHRIFYGDPARIELWTRLEEFFRDTYQHESGVQLRVQAAGIDTGGHYTTEAYKFCKRNAIRRFYALKGSSVRGSPLASRPSRSNKERVNLFSVGTEEAKTMLDGCLRTTHPGVGYIHFPIDVEEEFVKQLTNEKLVTEYKKGRPVKVYVPKSTGVRLEARDCYVYARAALEILRPNFNALTRKVAVKAVDPKAPDQANQAPPAKKKKKPKKRGSWFEGH